MTAYLKGIRPEYKQYKKLNMPHAQNIMYLLSCLRVNRWGTGHTFKVGGGTVCHFFEELYYIADSMKIKLENGLNRHLISWGNPTYYTTYRLASTFLQCPFLGQGRLVLPVGLAKVISTLPPFPLPQFRDAINALVYL